MCPLTMAEQSSVPSHCAWPPIQTWHLSFAHRDYLREDSLIFYIQHRAVCPCNNTGKWEFTLKNNDGKLFIHTPLL